MAYTKIVVYPVYGKTPEEEVISEIISNFKNKPIGVDRFQLADGQLLVVETSKHGTGIIFASMIFVNGTQECIDVPENDLDMIIPEVSKILQSSRRVKFNVFSVVGNVDTLFFTQEE